MRRDHLNLWKDAARIKTLHIPDSQLLPRRTTCNIIWRIPPSWYQSRSPAGLRLHLCSDSYWTATYASWRLLCYVWKRHDWNINVLDKVTVSSHVFLNQIARFEIKQIILLVRLLLKKSERIRQKTRLATSLSDIDQGIGSGIKKS